MNNTSILYRGGTYYFPSDFITINVKIFMQRKYPKIFSKMLIHAQVLVASPTIVDTCVPLKIQNK